MNFHDMPELFNGLLPLKQMFLVSPCVLAVVGASFHSSMQTYSGQAAVQLLAPYLSGLFWCMSVPLVRQFSLLYQQNFFAGEGRVC